MSFVFFEFINSANLMNGKCACIWDGNLVWQVIDCLNMVLSRVYF
jgi:hypothetical protein